MTGFVGIVDEDKELRMELRGVVVIEITLTRLIHRYTRTLRTLDLFRYEGDIGQFRLLLGREIFGREGEILVKYPL
jgi:hypothetical protein